MYDYVKLCTYLSPGDLWLLWTSFKSFCAQLDPAELQSATRPITNLCGFWKRILDAATKAAAAEEYPFECTITFYRVDLFLILRVLERILTGPQRDWLTDSAKKALGELRNFFSDRLYDPALEQGIGAPYRRQEAVLNDFYVGKKTALKAENIASPTPQQIIVFGVVLALLMPAERQPFSITSVADLMADLFRWNPVRTLEAINARYCQKLCLRNRRIVA